MPQKAFVLAANTAAARMDAKVVLILCRKFLAKREHRKVRKGQQEIEHVTTKNDGNGTYFYN